MSSRPVVRYRLLTRRAVLVGSMQLGALAVLGGRLYQLQVEQGEHFSELADKNRITEEFISPRRGRLLDRQGVVVVDNQQNFQILLVPEEADQFDDMNEIIERLSTIYPVTAEQRKNWLKEIERQPSFKPILLAEHLSWPQISRLSLNKPALPGVHLVEDMVRSYPLGESFAHLTGYIGAPTGKEATEVLKQGITNIGKIGLEQFYEQDLQGVAGVKQMEVNAHGRITRQISIDQGKAGKDLTLTIDSQLQRFVWQKLEPYQSASAVVMDIHHGDILAMASFPAFDANLFARGISSANWREMLESPMKPMINKTIAGQYPPGSTFKMITAITALEAGAITPNHRVFCRGYIMLGNHRFHCWKKGGHGTVDLTRALAESCDCYFYDVSQKIGIDSLAVMARRFGFGEASNIDLPGEKSGLMPDKDWKKQKYDAPWQLGETLICSIGQGYVKATPLQLAVMTAMLANGGRKITPRLVLNERPPQPTPPIIDSALLAPVLKGMMAVMQAGGTAAKVQIPEAGMEMAGKTGTAQVKRISMADRAAGVKNENLPWIYRHHALFVGYAPIDNPKFCCAVVVEHGGGGSAVAAPIARDILWETQKNYRAGV
ncbi:MAG: penicillin-binding protein 2 [Alphaproteobacteria bacterium]